MDRRGFYYREGITHITRHLLDHRFKRERNRWYLLRTGTSKDGPAVV